MRKKILYFLQSAEMLSKRFSDDGRPNQNNNSEEDDDEEGGEEGTRKRLTISWKGGRRDRRVGEMDGAFSGQFLVN
jgi:hypothetical protein